MGRSCPNAHAIARAKCDELDPRIPQRKLLHSPSRYDSVLCMCYTMPDGGRSMLYDIHPESPVPIYEQIVAQTIFKIASGALEVGELIPSVRDLAPRVLVHPNT